jgi:diguanylate cyclase (GGDEF)-like protein/PAS domain S-box-containing protein
VIDSDGWSIVLLTPTDRIRIYKWIGILATISVCLLILIFSGIVYGTDRSKEAFRQSEESKRLLLHAVGDGIVGVDATGQFTFVNPAALRMLGFSAEEMLGQNAHALVHHSRKDGSNYPVEDCPMYASFISATENHVEEEVLWRKDGSSFPVDYFSTPIFRNNRVVGVVVTFKDITERKQMEEEQRRSLEITEQMANETAVIAEIGQIISSTLDIDEVYERFAAMARKLIPFDSLIVYLKKSGGDTMDVVYAYGADIPGRRKGDSFPLKGSVSESVMRTRTSLIVPSADIVEKTGRFFTLGVNVQAGVLSMMSTPLIYLDEEIGALVFRSKKPDAYSEQDLRLAERIGVQITGAIANARLFINLNIATTELQESAGRFRAIFEQAAVGVAEVEMETGRFVMVNQQLCKIVGRTEEEMLATTFLALTHPDDLHLHEEQTTQLAAGKIGHYDLEKRYLRKDGGIVWVNLTISPLQKTEEASTHNLIVVQDITERRQAAEKIQQMAYHDSLTGLPNRKLFSDRLDIALAQSQRNQKEVGIAMLDLDHFKGVNDTLGHDVGDLLLKETAERLSAALRKGDTVARFAGDEFLLILPDLKVIEDAIRVAQKIVDSFRKPFLIDTHQLAVTTSIGIAVYPHDGTDEGILLKNADIAMYQAKQAGGDRYQLYKKA